MIPPFLDAAPDGIRIRIRVQPRASRTAVAGLHGNELKVRLAALPVDGAANEALVRFVAERLGVARRAVALVQGATSRSKVVAVAGVSLEAAARALAV
ncbi:MAG: DUF167 domain-containing protein [Gemmatimonadota bacterium]